MIREIALPVDHSLIIIMDQSAGVIPKSMNHALVAATDSAIAVGTRIPDDGDTRIILSNENPPPSPPLPILAFDGLLRTPERRVAICSILDEPLLAVDVLTTDTRIRVWTNDSSEPNEIFVHAG